MTNPDRQEADSLHTQWPAAAASGEYHDFEDVRLYRSARPDVFLFAPRRLAIESSWRNGRAQAAITLFRRWQDDGWVINGGSVLLAVSSAVQAARRYSQYFATRWRAELQQAGIAVSPDPVFLPLPLRRARLQVLLDRELGGNGGRDPRGIETNGETAPVVIDLTQRGALEWLRAIREKQPARGCLRWSFEYPQMLPEAETGYVIDGTRVVTRQGSPAGPLIAGPDTEIQVDMTVRARVWRPMEIETGLSELLHTLDESYVNFVTVQPPAGFPVVTRAALPGSDPGLAGPFTKE
ncbi:MAG: hypothetical protein ACKV2V_05960 [Blastocatellia bacterium]